MNNSPKYNSIVFGGLLTICFIVLKLVGVINWSWLWVLSPIWFVPLLFIIIFIIACWR